MIANDTMKTKDQISQALEIIKSREVENVFFISCGGSFALMYLSEFIIDVQSENIDAHIYSSNEFLYRKHGKLSEKSIVLFCSHSGNTAESVEASKYAKEKGALTISLTSGTTGKLTEICDINLKYEWGLNPFDSSHSILYQITFGILYVKEKNDKFKEITSDLEQLQDLFDVNTDFYEKESNIFADNHEHEKVIYSVASGMNYGVAYGFSICSMMEQQWIHSNSIHAGEYFHGPFEIVDEDVPVVIMLGVGSTRPMDERALTFTKKYSNKVTVVDANDFNYLNIEESNKEYIAPLIMNHLVRYFAEKLSIKRNHPLSTRRYMGVVEY